METDFPAAEKSPGAGSEAALGRGGGGCPLRVQEAFFSDAPRPRGPGSYYTPHARARGGLCSGAGGVKGPSAQLDAAVALLCGALRGVEMTGLFVSQEEQAYRPSCWNPSFGHLIPQLQFVSTSELQAVPSQKPQNITKQRFGSGDSCF